jgi:diguanylate cyclase (GGDEF)-like protein
MMPTEVLMCLMAAVLAMLSAVFCLSIYIRDPRWAECKYWGGAMACLGLAMATSPGSKTGSNLWPVEGTLLLLSAICMFMCMSTVHRGERGTRNPHASWVIGFVGLTAGVLQFAGKNFGVGFLLMALIWMLTAGCGRIFNARRHDDVSHRLILLLLLVAFGAAVVMHLFASHPLGPLRVSDAAIKRIGVDALALLNTVIVAGSYVVAAYQEKKRYASLVRDASLDHLSGLMTRGSFELAAAATIAASRRPCALLMIDADHFKGLNDLHGHPIGDEVIRRLGEVIKRSIREEDLAARYGGDEFCVLLQACDLLQARTTAERIVRDVGLATSTIEALSGKRQTVSIGYVSTDIQGGIAPASATLPELFVAADRALYEAKARGRNAASAGQLDETPREIRNALSRLRAVPSKPAIARIA